jgi:hypothetical protein
MLPFSMLDPGFGAHTTRITILALLAGWPALYHTSLFSGGSAARPFT